MNVKPGDLAIVIDATLPENIGKLVKVIEPCFWEHPSGLLSWVVENTSPTKLCSLAGNEVHPVGSVGACPDAWLRPVSGLPDEQHTEEDNKLEA